MFGGVPVSNGLFCMALGFASTNRAPLRTKVVPLWVLVPLSCTRLPPMRTPCGPLSVLAIVSRPSLLAEPKR
ncbi:MAG: hypothetical protein MUF04_07520 [Akkermansiaceae bacterium]|nr:hypothetical protein [Akkermansiaceae bacterium]